MPRKARRWVLIGSLSFGVLVVVCAAWLGWRVWTVKSELDALVPLAAEARTAIDAGDRSRLSEVSQAMSAGAERAATAAGDPLWRLAEAIPGAGENLVAVRVVATELDRVAQAAPGVLEITESLEDRAPGTLVDTAALAASSAQITDSARSFARSAEALAALDVDALISPVARGVSQVRDVVDALAPLTGVAAGAADILPGALGGEGVRSILLMVQNPAELRTGGGISGSFVELQADGGRLTLARQADSSEFPRLTTPIVEVPATTTALYGDGVARYVQNASMTPDFAATGDIVSAWWSTLTGRTPDMVVSVDPYTLQALLTVTGPVTLPSGAALNADNVLDTLLVQPYVSLASDQQTELFSAAVEAVFARVADGSVDALGVLRAVEKPAADGRISVWSAHDDEQELIARSALGGPLARQDAAGPGAFAVYFNDATGGKMAGYLDVAIDSQTVECRADGLTDVALTVTMGSHAPADVGSLPFSVTGGGMFGVGIGDIGTNVTVTAPRGSFVGEVIVKGERYPAATAIEGERAASTARVNLSPSEVNTLEFHFLVPRDDADSVRIVHTPLMNAADVSIDGGCAATVSP
ncbi:DUF4012 domain-containing protein [Microbacterium yannicii]|nr:DUF4012 domain-containing protein [Microbacterium yannicii]MCO5951944.1 DUF4012 domain-containing protein [Microbacterium yannicii]